jgi:hypothetical protein
MEAVMVVVSGIAIFAAVFALLSHGWLPSLALLILSAMAFALSRMFDLVGDLFASIHGCHESTKPPVVERSESKT